MEIFTIGHSTRTIDEFIKILQDNNIKYVIDVRSYPSSKIVPWFDKDALKKTLAKFKIKYIHMLDLGGRRHNVSHVDTSIESKSFSSYAEYMRTDEFAKGIKKLKKIASKHRTVIMCSEAVYWRCHRKMIADRFTFDKWKVYHLGIGKKPMLHEIWNIARLNNKNQIIYDK